MLVVPTAVDARHYTRELAGARRGAGLGADLRRAGAGDRPARRLRRPAPVGPPARAGPGARRSARRGWTRSRPSADAPGFVAAAGELIAELQRGLITPQRFAAALRTWAAQDERRAGYARDVARIYGDYARELERLRRVDARAVRLAGAGRAARRPRAVGGRSGVLLRLRRADGARARRRRDAVADRRRRGDRVADLRAGPRGAGLARRGGGGAAPAGHAGARAPGARRSLRARIAPRPAPSRALAVRARAGADRARGGGGAAGVRRRARRGGAGRGHGARAAARPACRARRSWSFTARSRARRRCCSAPCGSTGSRWPAPARSPSATRRWGGRCSARRAARCWRNARPAPGTCSTTCAPRVCWSALTIADALEADVLTLALTTAAQARGRLGRRPAELDALAAAPDPLAALCELAQRLFAAPHRGAAPALSAAEELDAHALATLTAARAELAELGLQLPAAAADRAARSASGADRGGGGGRRGAAGRAPADPRAALPGRVRLRPAGGRVSAAGPPGAVSARRAPPGAGRLLGAAAAPARGRAGPRALPVLRGGLAGHRAGRPELPQLRRGGQPGAALAVRGRRRRAAGRGLARAPRATAAGRRRLAGRSRADHGRAGAVAGGRRGAGDRGGAGARAGARGAGAERGPPQPDPVRRGARDLRRLPDEVAGRARAAARGARARAGADRRAAT